MQPYKVGEKVLVRYSASNPSEVRLDNELERTVGYHHAFGTVMAVFAVFFALLAAATRRKV